MSKTSLYNFLALAGTLPFIGCALLPLFGVSEIAPLGPLDSVANSYGLLVSFMAGAHWGQFLTGNQTAPVNLFISSNVIALLVWFAYLGAGVKLAIAGQLLAFLTLLSIDYRLRSADIISQKYWRTRMTVTSIVVLSQLLIIVN